MSSPALTSRRPALKGTGSRSFPHSKSAAAFRFTCEQLFAEHPHIYFWTFTFKSVACDWQYAGAWRGFIREVSNRYKHRIGHQMFSELQGVRVLEPHKRHGLHYHCLLNVRIPIEFIRRIGPKYGIGIVWVDECDWGAVGYLEKYLSKSFKHDLFGGVHKWAKVGSWFGRGYLKNQIQLLSPAHNTIRWFTKYLGQLPYHISNLTYHYAKCYGQLEDWAFDEKRKFLASLFALAGRKYLVLCLRMYQMILAELPKDSAMQLRLKYELRNNYLVW